MIDLGEPAGIGTRVLAAGARGLGVIFGRQAVVDARDAVIGLFR
jgi:hypothetical protein